MSYLGWLHWVFNLYFVKCHQVYPINALSTMFKLYTPDESLVQHVRNFSNKFLFGPPICHWNSFQSFRLRGLLFSLIDCKFCLLGSTNIEFFIRDKPYKIWRISTAIDYIFYSFSLILTYKNVVIKLF